MGVVLGGSTVGRVAPEELLSWGQGGGSRPRAEPGVGSAGPTVDPPVVPGAELASGLRVLAHRRRGNDLDAYDCWSASRYSRCFVKVLRPDRTTDSPARRRLVREARLLLTLTHPHLVRAYELLQPGGGCSPLLVLETIAGPTLRQRLDDGGRLSFPDLVRLGRQLCAATRYLHDRGYLHLDVKPSNIVGEGEHARLIDLSSARRPGPAAGGWGTSDQMAPEQARGGTLTSAADVWGVGLVLYEAVTGYRPFSPAPGTERGGRARFLQLRVVAPPVRTRRRLPAALGAALDSCLDTRPAARPTLAELDAALATLS